MSNRRARSQILKAVLLSAISLAAAVSACRFAQPLEDKIDGTDEVQLRQAPTAIELITTDVATRPNCPEDPGAADLPGLDQPATLAREIVEFLDRGGEPGRLHSYLVEAERSPPDAGGLGRADLDGDGIEEIALVLLSEGDLLSTPPGTLMIFICTDGGFTLAYSTAPLQDRGAPLIHSVADLTGDGLADLVYQRELCGAHTCTAETQVLSWHEGALEEVFPDSTDELPSPLLEIGPAREDGSRPISVTATGINSIGAGPFRPTTYTWTWDPNQSKFTLESEQQAPARFRIHMLHEADRSAREGNLALALEQYERVEQDDSLEGWVDPELELRVLGAYARFRRIVLHTRLEERGRAQEAFDGLILQYAGDPETAAIVEMAQAYWETYTQDGTLIEACLSARTFAAAHSSQVLDRLYFGYANPSYTAQDVCLQGAEGQP